MPSEGTSFRERPTGVSQSTQDHGASHRLPAPINSFAPLALKQGHDEALASHRIPDYQPRKFHRGESGPILISLLIITFG